MLFRDCVEHFMSQKYFKKLSLRHVLDPTCRIKMSRAELFIQSLVLITTVRFSTQFIRKRTTFRKKKNVTMPLFNGSTD